MARLRFLALVAAFALALSGGASAHAAEKEASQARPDREAALDLARLVMPTDLAEIELRKTREAFYAGLREDQDMASLETEYPGIHDAMWVALEPIMREYSQKTDPRLMARLGDLYAARLTRIEIDALIAFYSTPTGKRLIRTVSESADYRPMVQAGLVDRATTAADIGEVQKGARAAVLDSVTEADHAALKELGRSISLTKANELSGEVRQLMADWMNEPDPEMEARIEAALVPAIDAHMAKAAPEE